ncbi:hypothetical protein [Novosphingobium sp. Rr 2-17]|nr:hypothetical protein [Novosphingobium sp. Rr 2-17]
MVDVDFHLINAARAHPLGISLLVPVNFMKAWVESNREGIR